MQPANAQPKYPYSIQNGHGETLTFMGKTMKDGVEALIVDNIIKAGGGPPMHVHHLQSEALTVLEGTLVYQINGQEPVTVRKGQSATFEKGVLHKFWNPGPDDLICTGMVWPALNFEYFINHIFESIKHSPKARPETFDAAFLLTKYKSEFDMAIIPPFVKKAVFPVVNVIGKLSGKHKKFAGAPAAF